MMKLKRLSLLIPALMVGIAYMSDVSGAVEQAPASVEVPATPVAVDLTDVKTEHVSLLERFVALLKRDEQWIVDNIEAGVAALEGMFESKSEAPAAPEAPAQGTTS